MILYGMITMGMILAIGLLIGWWLSVPLPSAEERFMHASTLTEEQSEHASTLTI